MRAQMRASRSNGSRSTAVEPSFQKPLDDGLTETGTEREPATKRRS
jgi:hypothetical protein